MDLFPVAVTRPDGALLTQIRLAVRSGVTTLWRWQGSGPVRVLESAGHPVDDGKDRYRIETPDGPWLVRYTPNDCGCGHPMKVWRPRPHRAEVRR
jgi:hypothetical protein